MEISIPETRSKNFTNISSSLGIQQASDSPHTDVKSSLSSAGSTEQGCCSQILAFLKACINWIASFFCSSDQLSELDKKLQKHLENFVRYIKYEDLDEPCILLGVLIKDFQESPEDEEVKKQFPTYLSMNVHLIEKNATQFTGNQIVNFYLSVGRELLTTRKLNEQEIMSRCNPSEEMRERLQTRIHEYNKPVNFDIEFQKYLDNLVKRCNSEEEENRCFEGDGPILLLNEIISLYEEPLEDERFQQQKIPNKLVLVYLRLSELLKNDDLYNNMLKAGFTMSESRPIFSRTKLRDFYFTVTCSLIDRNQLDEEVIVRCLNADIREPVRQKIRELNEKLKKPVL